MVDGRKTLVLSLRWAKAVEGHWHFTRWRGRRPLPPTRSAFGLRQSSGAFRLQSVIARRPRLRVPTPSRCERRFRVNHHHGDWRRTPPEPAGETPALPEAGNSYPRGKLFADTRGIGESQGPWVHPNPAEANTQFSWVFIPQQPSACPIAGHQVSNSGRFLGLRGQKAALALAYAFQAS